MGAGAAPFFTYFTMILLYFQHKYAANVCFSIMREKFNIMLHFFNCEFL